MRVHAIQTGTVAVRRAQIAGRGPFPLRAVNTLLDPVWTTPLPILCWLIEHPEGLIVVDTGETAQATQDGWFPRWHPSFSRGLREWVAPEEEVGPQLRRLGVDPGDVRWVVLTHLHTDHAGGLGYFPRSEVVVGGVEHRRAAGRLGQVAGYLPQHWPSWFSPTLVEFSDAPPYGPVARSRPLTAAGDVILLSTPGHTRGHLSVAVDTGDHHVVLAGDTSYTERLLLDGIADGVTDAPGTARRTMAQLRALTASRPTVYLPSHDPESRERLAAMRPVAPV